MSKGIGRASARTSDVCPNGSDFGRVAAAIDELDRIGGERVGGPTPAEELEAEQLEGRIHRLRPSTIADWQWLALRLARALENGWHGGAVKPLLKLAG
jgi:hypothetical protein